MGATIDCEIRDKDGNLVSKTTKQSDSFVSNFLLAMYGLTTAGATLTSGIAIVTDTGGNLLLFPSASSLSKPLMYAMGVSGNTSFGIQVGLSGTAPLSSDYSLNGLCTTIGYSSTSGWGIANNSGAWVYFNRVFTNNTGSNIVIQEAGIAVQDTTSNSLFGSSSGAFLILHDVTGAQTVAPNNALTVNYSLYTYV